MYGQVRASIECTHGQHNVKPYQSHLVKQLGVSSSFSSLTSFTMCTLPLQRKEKEAAKGSQE